MVPVSRFSAAKKGKSPQVEPELLPPKKKPDSSHGTVVEPMAPRPLHERAPPGFPITLYARAQGPAQDDRHREERSRGGGQAAAVRPPPSRTHAEGSAREFMVWAATPPHTWIRLPGPFAREIPPRGPVELWLQHDGCCG